MKKLLEIEMSLCLWTMYSRSGDSPVPVPGMVVTGILTDVVGIGKEVLGESL